MSFLQKSNSYMFWLLIKTSSVCISFREGIVCNKASGCTRFPRRCNVQQDIVIWYAFLEICTAWLYPS